MNNRINNNLVHFGPNEVLVRALVEAKVKFIVVGGLAVAWHCPERQADDMDLLIEASVENSVRVAVALAKLQMTGFAADSFAKPSLQVPLKGVYHAELLTPKQESLTFGEVEATAVQAKLFGIPVCVASSAALIAMKKHAIQAAPETQEKHLNDVALLEKHGA